MKPLDKDKTEKAETKEEEKPVEAAPVVEEKIDFSNVEIEPLFQDQVDFDTFSKSDFRAVKVKECEAVKKSKKLLKFVLDDGTGTDRVILSGIHEYYEPEELVGKTCIAITNLPPRAMMGIDSCGMLISAVHHENGEEIAGSYDFHTAYIGNRRCIMLTPTEELATLPALKKQKHI